MDVYIHTYTHIYSLTHTYSHILRGYNADNAGRGGGGGGGGFGGGGGGGAPFGDIFGNMFGGGRGQQHQQRQQQQQQPPAPDLYSSPDGVLPLNKQKYPGTSARSLWFIHFYNPQSNEDKRIKDSVISLAKKLKEADLGVKVGTVNCQAEKGLGGCKGGTRFALVAGENIIAYTKAHGQSALKAKVGASAFYAFSLSLADKGPLISALVLALSLFLCPLVYCLFIVYFLFVIMFKGWECAMMLLNCVIVLKWGKSLHN